MILSSLPCTQGETAIEVFVRQPLGSGGGGGGGGVRPPARLRGSAQNRNGRVAAATPRSPNEGKHIHFFFFHIYIFFFPAPSPVPRISAGGMLPL